MAFTDLPLFQAIKSKMQWHQTRQGVLAENIAHADTPGYEARDVIEYSFEDHLARQSGDLSTATTRAGHIAVSMSGAGGVRTSERDTFEITPDGNSVTLEEQMMKITENQMNYQAATTLYTKGLGFIRTALSKTA
ncbi:flagellar basal body rod protein FlgB [Roseibium denhamense]|uniref:Flagellar basal body rod protein FlgB n=1 Tax=Roseibium denhamense TaxID=76305 RepID=A0ABY1N7X7_9HYPH|nr:flagellar basal body rod protein FlgB [Roseibium denhamense]MTI05953.1 flagellar basal body rod protein FlgB [Roseibium denhamense]SMP02801.1 flagellar basal-body rod protein FlgB [Roseibium denhamense]